MLAAVRLDGDEYDVTLWADDGGIRASSRLRCGRQELADIEQTEHPRWLFGDSARDYPDLVSRGITVDRCHDVAMVERILVGRAPSPRLNGSLEDAPGDALDGAPDHAPDGARDHAPDVARDHAPDGARDHAPDVESAATEPALFGGRQSRDEPGAATADELLAAYLDQRHRQLSGCGSPLGEAVSISPNALRLLCAAESASGLAAVEMSAAGLPWDRAVHEDILQVRLGPPPIAGQKPAALVRLGDQIERAFGGPVNVDSNRDLQRAFRAAGFPLVSVAAGVLRTVDHPAASHLIAYRELHRLWSANGWTWLARWVRDGRFHPEYLPGAVVSGRWAARGGGALQIPRHLRRAVVAGPGRRLVVADAAQLEPRVLIALSGDDRLRRLATADDLYAAVAGDGFAGRREDAKRAMLGAMYGATSGAAGQLLGVLRARFPVAMDFVADAARRGERGGLVCSVLGRVSPPPPSRWYAAVAAGAMPTATGSHEREGRAAASSWGRFTRNFVIQSSAADWASVWLSCVRRDLRSACSAGAAPGAELVFFQHDELVVEVEADAATFVADLVANAAVEASALVFPAVRDWRVPVRPQIVQCYADAK